MNKRQAKKKRNKHLKGCKKCKYLMYSEHFGFKFCGLFLMCQPCINELRKKVE